MNKSKKNVFKVVNKFLSSPYLYWKDTENHKKVCDKYAEVIVALKHGDATYEESLEAYVEACRLYSLTFRYIPQALLAISLYLTILFLIIFKLIVVYGGI